MTGLIYTIQQAAIIENYNANAIKRHKNPIVQLVHLKGKIILSFIKNERNINILLTFDGCFPILNTPQNKNK